MLRIISVVLLSSPLLTLSKSRRNILPLGADPPSDRLLGVRCGVPPPPPCEPLPETLCIWGETGGMERRPCAAAASLPVACISPRRICCLSCCCCIWRTRVLMPGYGCCCDSNSCCCCRRSSEGMSAWLCCCMPGGDEGNGNESCREARRGSIRLESLCWLRPIRQSCGCELGDGTDAPLNGDGSGDGMLATPGSTRLMGCPWSSAPWYVDAARTCLRSKKDTIRWLPDPRTSCTSPQFLKSCISSKFCTVEATLCTESIPCMKLPSSRNRATTRASPSLMFWRRCTQLLAERRSKYETVYVHLPAGASTLQAPKELTA
mmetsp:Transcript_5083/g.12819  ORF Transcript_5083/g.12819 Transcript_5083/m.12819 type:complete len:319 (+) Transcript_5083:2264-3220(+)